MGGKRVLSDTITPEFLMGLCEGLTDFQAYDRVKPFLGHWIKVRGHLVFATPNPKLGTAGVTVDFPEENGKRREAFMTFDRNFGGLAKAGQGDVIWAEGMITSISSSRMQLEDCELLDPRLAATLEVSYQAEELRKAAESRLAAGDPITLKPAQPRSDPEPQPSKADTRKNAPPAEMEKFCKLLLEGWPNTTESVAHAKAVAFFPDNRVPVKAFLDTFRAIRGERKPGPQPKSKN